ncbi:DNA/RNA helicase, DEAD/DEAH box type domain-containing protein [Rozella allomycis CSF55]|uniref:ATP-dependent RNA helicase n=1 Tax=Rozella allomycis (strain CSF55) TaxID=988480 RepID=A0A075APV5_ROZAC|nr:DNA/RNA helicase, DEAD/DEAH box type domain-containing protein [Rozella allomycis CSF55]|eukprot:EPZ32206.1 DNA/RNA helicase, DEAD/DEAH box type domain-containing protein [Rozella allomycis CSF55]
MSFLLNIVQDDSVKKKKKVTWKQRVEANRKKKSKRTYAKEKSDRQNFLENLQKDKAEQLKKNNPSDMATIKNTEPSKVSNKDIVLIDKMKSPSTSTKELLLKLKNKSKGSKPVKRKLEKTGDNEDDISEPELQIKRAKRPATGNSKLSTKQVPQEKTIDRIELITTERKSQEYSQDIFGNEELSFEGLGLLPSVIEKLDKNSISKPTIIQSKTIGCLLEQPERDLCMQSMTGSGKTLAFLLPVIQRCLLLAESLKVQNTNIRDLGTLAIVLTPTRELAQQIYSVLEKLLSGPLQVSDECRVTLVPGVIVGGDKRKSEKARLRKGIHILVATPGRLLDHLQTTSSFDSKFIQTLILDETDRLMDMGFEKKVKEILELLKNKSEKTFQVILCSATLPEKVSSLAGETLKNPVTIHGQLQEEGKIVIPSNLIQKCVVVPTKLRFLALYSLLEKHIKLNMIHNKEPFKAIVFLACKDSVEFYHTLLTFFKRESLKDAESDDESDSEDEEQLEDGKLTAAKSTSAILSNFPIFRLHGSMEQIDRSNIFKEYSKSQNGILFCTDVAARGLDWNASTLVNMIVQFDAPCDVKDFVHRIGRTARLNNRGEAVLFMQPSEIGYVEVLKEMGMEFISEECDVLLSRIGDENAQIKLQYQYEQFVEEKMVKMARTALMSYLKAYSTHPQSEKAYFHVKNLHLGHVAKSFGLKEKPIESKKYLSGAAKRKEEAEAAKKRGRVMRQKINPASEFAAF